MKRTVVILFAFLPLAVFAQRDSLRHRLDSVVVTATRGSEFSAGIKTVHYDSAALQRYGSASLAELLGAESDLFLKSYSPGGLSTSAFRGAGASHTAVVWNGFSLISPMHGQLDLSLLPMLFIDDISIQYGGSGTLWGSGNVGGAILLNSPARFGKNFSADVFSDAGSFGELQEAVRVNVGQEKYGFSLRGFYRQAENNFPFVNYALPGSPRMNEANADLRQSGALPECWWKVGERNIFSARSWIQQSDRGIPPTLTQPVADARQIDDSQRSMLDWTHYRDKSKWITRIGWLRERLDYRDTLFQIDSHSKAQSLVAESEVTFRLSPNQLVQVGVNNNFTTAFAEEYVVNKQQNRTALFTAWSMHLHENRVLLTAAFREEQVDGKLTPFIPSAGGVVSVLKWLDVRGNFSRCYRLPTFNDLYWFPGGNPDLQPELGWNGDAGLTLKKETHHWSFESDVTAFQRRMTNWIIWLPNTFGYWSPENLLQVNSRGIETAHHMAWTNKPWTIRLAARTSYVRSTNEKAASPTDASIGKQLIYVPFNKASGSLFIGWKNWSAYYTHTFTGFRYITSDNVSFLPGFDVASLQIAWQGKWNKTSFRLFASAENMFDQYYEVISSRPMAGRSYHFGIRLSFNNKINTPL